MAKEITISSERLNADHPLGPLVPMERFDWERILGRCKFKPRSSAKVVGYTLATFADLKTGGNIKPGNELIGLRAGVGKNAVINAMQTLHDIGLIHKVRNGSNFGRGGKTSEFRLTAPEGLAETYYEERNARTWDYSDQWPIETWLEQVGSSGHVPNGEQVYSSGHVSSESEKNRFTQTPEQVCSNAEQVCSNAETGLLTVTLRNQEGLISGNQIRESSAASPSATLSRSDENFAAAQDDDDFQNSTQAQYAAALDHLLTLEDHGAKLLAAVEDSNPDLSLTQRVIEAANLARQRKGKAA